MQWIKIGQINKNISISEQKARDLVKKKIWIKDIHYVDNPHIGHRLFNLEEIEKWLVEDAKNVSNDMQEMLKDW